jgi:chemotaxis methyl-accepting protein methylase
LSFKKYFTTVLGSYVFLYSIYSLVYFGALSFLTENIPNYVGVILLLLFAVLIYFSKVIKQKLIGDNEKLLLEDK